MDIRYSGWLARYEKIVSMRKDKKTFREISESVGVSFQRVEQILKNGPPKPRVHSKETKTYKIFSGKPKWLRYGREWTREQVRARDNYACRNCGKKWVEGMRRFDIHHLNGMCGKKSLSYDSVKDMKNLITYCHKCHLNLDSVRKKMSNANKKNSKNLVK